MKRLKVTILGSGCSTGVPRVDGYWGACDPKNPKNRRSRCSAWFGLYDDAQSLTGQSLTGRSLTPESLTGQSLTPPLTSVIIDTAPDFREQVLRAGITAVDAVLWTHDHADQTHGIDDVRAMTFARGQPIDGYMDEATYATFMSRFRYLFEGKFSYSPVYNAHLIPPHGEAWSISGQGGAIPIVTFDQQHGPIRSVGYRLGDIAYSSDISDMPEASFAALDGVKLWIVDALRDRPHPTHSHIDQTLAWIERAGVERAILTNLHQDLDYEALKSRLPQHVEPAYDGLSLEFSVSF